MKRRGVPVDGQVSVAHVRPLFRAVDFAAVAKPRRERRREEVVKRKGGGWGSCPAQMQQQNVVTSVGAE